MGLIISELEIENFRSIEQLKLKFDDDRSLFFGKNDSGKTNILKAINSAFNNTSHVKEDVFISNNAPFDINKKIIINIKISPYNYIEKKIVDNFTTDWETYFGEYINIKGSSQYFSFSTQIYWDANKQAYIKDRYLISDWDSRQLGAKLKYDILDPIDCFYIPTNRDLVEDILNKNSIWNKFIPKMQINDSEREAIAKQTKKISDKIIRNSNLLTLLKKELMDLETDNKDKVDLEAITHDIDKIYNGINVYIKNDKNGRIGLEGMGAGTRSRAVFKVIKALIDKRNKEEGLYFPVLLLEEPEANLHYNLQKTIFNEITKIKCNSFITTHSPFAFCNDSYLSFYNVINKTSSSVSNTSLKNYKENERLQIYKEILNNNAQFFFADKVVFAEGATEEIVLPIYFKKYFKKEPYYKNISIVGVGGNNYKYFIKIANDLKIPWYVFSDGEQNTINKLEKNLSYGLNLQNINIANYPNVIIIPNGFDYEKYLQVNGYSDIMIKSISGKIGENCLTFKGWMRKNHGNKIKGKERDYKSKGAKERALEDFFNKEKILHAKDVAEAISRSRIGIPKIIEELFIEIEKE